MLFILLATGCDGLGSAGSLSHFIYMFIDLYVWFLCEKLILLLLLLLLRRLISVNPPYFFLHTAPSTTKQQGVLTTELHARISFQDSRPRKKFDDIFSRFDTIHDRNGRTGGVLGAVPSAAV